MMDDMVLDQLLARWRDERAPRAEDFASEACFETRFFAAVGAEALKRAPKNPRRGGLAAASLPNRFKLALAPGGICADVCYSMGIPAAASDSEFLFNKNDGATPILDTEEYKTVGERPFVSTATNPLSTFGADVDTAMYSNLRRMILDEERLPAPEAVRIEELINYFGYDYPMPEGSAVMRPRFEEGRSPWAPERRLLLVGVQAKTPAREHLPPSHYVFLIDNSGSMGDVFPMVKEAMTALAGQLRPGDRVSMITYGGGGEVLLEGCADAETVRERILSLDTGGYTPGGEGIQNAYRIAEKHFIEGGNNRIVLVTDGDFNVGASSEAALVEMVRAKRDTGIYLSIAGCGMGNYKDNKLKMLANQGNGNVFYLDSVREAKRVFVHGMTGNMYALARDVKFQIEFNPAKVFAYRLLGYELREMTDRDFRDDGKESGTVGLGQQVTALYEIIPADAPDEVKDAAVPGRKPLKYVSCAPSGSDELLTFRIRYRDTQGRGAAHEESEAVKLPLPETANFGWAAAVAEFALALRCSRFAPAASAKHAAETAQKFLGEDPRGERAEFLLMLRRAAELRRKTDK